MTTPTQPYPFPHFDALPRGTVYAGAPSDYGSTHISSILSSSSASDPASVDRGLTVFSPETCTSSGLVRIARDRLPASHNQAKPSVLPPTDDALAKGARPPDAAQPGFQIWHEVHGSGPQKVVFVMGLNNSSFGWLNQVEHFARDGRYSLLVLDNRGYGNSETPADLSKYSTHEMAQDVLEVCGHLGWTDKRQLHVVGISMGGMIALEVAKAAPERLASLCLLSTTSGRSTFGLQKSLTAGLPPLGGLAMITRIVAGKALGLDSDEYRVRRVADTLFPPAWLDKPSEADPAGKVTNREATYAMFEWRFHFTRRQNPHGTVGQIRAALTHRVPNDALRRIGQGVPSILVATGDWDNLVSPGNSRHLAKHIPGARLSLYEGAGHALQVQEPQRLNAELQRCWEEGWAKAEKEGK